MQNLIYGELEKRFADDPIRLNVIFELKKRQAMPTGTYPSEQPQRKKVFGNQVTDTRKFGVDPSAAQARQQLQPIAEEIKMQAEGLTEPFMTFGKAAQGDPEARAELKSRVAPWAGPKDKMYLGTFPSAIKPWSTPQQKLTSAATSISYPNPEVKAPIIFNEFRKGKLELGPINADIGGGRYNNITNWLKEKGVKNIVWDRFNRSKNENVFAQRKLSGGKADTATVSNVLNVIADKENRLVTIATAHDSIKPGGKAYFTTYTAPKSGEIRGRDSFQTGMKTVEYIPEIEEIFGKGNVTKQGDVIIATKGD